MASQVTPKKNAAFICYIALPSQSNPLVFQANPTLATGDAKVSIDGAALADLATLPDVDPNSSKLVKIALSSSEMNGDNIQVILSDAAGDEWCDVMLNIQTTARQVDDLAFPNTTGRGMDVTTGGGVGIDWSNVEAPTTSLNLSGTTIATSQVVASVTGAVGSVTGAVGSVTGNVSGNVTGSVGSLATQAKADVNGEVLDVLNVDTYGEATGVPTFPNSAISMIRRLFTTQVNPLATTATAKTLKNAAGVAQWKKVVADDNTTYTEGGGVAP